MNATAIDFASICVCPDCRGRLAATEGSLRCTSCDAEFEVGDGIARLMPRYEDERRRRYVENYDRIARDDLEHAVVPDRERLLHDTFLEFIGDLRGAAVLDIGAAYGSSLTRLDAARKVAVDIALPYLERIEGDGVLRVLGDAERLPVDLGSFDAVVISDVLEHLLEPEALVGRLAAELRDGARVFVHIPWQESLEQYRDSPYEFVHLRTFDEHSFRSLFRDFDVRREHGSLPRLSRPLVFSLKPVLPRRVYNALVHAYFHSRLNEAEGALRQRWIDRLPRRERSLLWFFTPTVKMFELVPAKKRRRMLSAADRTVERAARVAHRMA